MWMLWPWRIGWLGGFPGLGISGPRWPSGLAFPDSRRDTRRAGYVAALGSDPSAWRRARRMRLATATPVPTGFQHQPGAQQYARVRMCVCAGRAGMAQRGKPRHHPVWQLRWL